MSSAPVVAVWPSSKRLETAVVQGGARLGSLERAQGLIWTDPDTPLALSEALQRNPQIRWVQLPFAGIERFMEAGVVDSRRTWTCAKGIYGAACAEHALLLMLSAARRMHEHIRAQRWTTAQVPERRLWGARVVIFGAGGIARDLLPLLMPFKVHVTVVSRSGKYLEGANAAAQADQLPALVRTADFTVVAAPLTDQTRRLFDKALFRCFRPDGWLINVARGGLVDTDALVHALNERHLGGAALDVTEPEPLPDDHPLWRCPNVIITPHIANTRAMGAPELAAMVTRNVERFVRGESLEGGVDVLAQY